MIPRRYQLKKDAVAILEKGHPWLFRDQMSSAATVFADGDWLRLVDGSNRVVGYGIYEAEGAIAIRMLRRGSEAPNAAWVRAQLGAALAKRASVAARTDAVRLINGESDGLAGVVVDRFADTIVVASYSQGVDALAHYIAKLLAGAARGRVALEVASPDGEHDAADTQPIEIMRTSETPDGRFSGVGAALRDDPDLIDAGLTAPIAVTRPGTVARAPTPPPASASDLRAFTGAATNVVLRPARRRRGPAVAQRVLCGTAPAIVTIHEDDRALAVDLEGGHKTGTYLDLRALRRLLADAPLANARVLNLFAYTGMLGMSVERAGAAAITDVDQSARALAFAKDHHAIDPAKHGYVVADVFEWLPALPDTEQYDLVICDPPAMASQQSQIPTALAAYRKLYKAAARHVLPGGAVVAACCTSRIERKLFEKTVREALGPGFTLERDLPPEPDHPVGFAQADYLKVHIWRRR
ncbi:MAG: class I SAM-dependent methyltransferase [Kofleriaceae bacterium]